MMHAELECVVCNGPARGKHSTYALVDERIPTSPVFTSEERLVMLATRYFTSHGPATLKDFVWWSGLTVAQAREAHRLDGIRIGAGGGGGDRLLVGAHPREGRSA